ncbi:MAG TPA: Gfo/Idh/MocA family oxidoreductase [Hyphomicrobiales bacterium]|jgi:predicted dehydrogenase
METIGVGLIGTGFMGKCHALAWNAVRPVFGDCAKPRLVHLAEAGEALARERAGEFGFARSTGEWRDLLADPEVEVISVTAPNAFHAEMAIAALEAGKHVWCEKPMAPSLADAVRMRDAARASGKVAALGYNYIQNPAIRHIKSLLKAGTIGTVNHLRIEMDEDFMADPAALFYWKSEATSGYGALDDFAVHPLSLIATLLGPVEAVMADMAKPYADRPLKEGGRREVETYDIASVLMRLAGGVSGVLMANRSAWGRKGRIALQIFGSKGTILYDQERMNEYQLYVEEGGAAERGFRTVLTAPVHKPYDRFIPAPGHGLGFNDLKIIECRELLSAIAGAPAHIVDFDAGYEIEKTVHAMARSFAERNWVTLSSPN